MLRNAFTKWLWDARRSVLGWAGAVAFVGGGYAAFWPIIDSPALRDALASYPKALLEAINYTDITTPAGYLNATVYGLLAGVLVVVYSVAAGTRIVAGDEEAGTLDLILAHPISRTRLALSRFASYLASIVAIVAALWVAILIVSVPAGLEGIPAGGYAAMHIHLVLFAAFFGALSYAVGAASGRRAWALAAGSAAGVLGYVANGIIPQVEGLEWVRNLSPFHWLNGGEPLQNGIRAGDALLMLGLVVVLVAAGTLAFERRDIAT